MVTLRGTIVIDGAREHSHVRIAGDRLTFGPPAAGAEVIDGWVFPGLVDVHCHLGLSAQGIGDEEATIADARTTAATGVLLVRDAGYPRNTRFLGARPDSPRVIRAGRHVARPKRYIRDLPIDVEDPDQLAETLAEQALAGDGWVKVVGDWIDRDLAERADLRPLWTPEQLARGFAAAHGNGARIAVHTFAEESIEPLLKAGVDSIEHGTGMRAEHMQRAAEAGIAVTPTLLQIENFPAIADQAAERFPRYAARMRAMYDRREQQVRDLYEAGVQLLVGSDAGGGVAHGSLPAEAAALVRAGVPARAVVAAATYQARTYLGVAGISEGAPADVVVYPEDPRENIAVLAHPTAVFRAGRRIR